MAKIEEMIAKAKIIEPTQAKRGGGKQICSLSVVNCDNGKRVTMSALLYEELGTPETVQVAVDSKYLYISENLGRGSILSYSVSNKKRGYIYSATLVGIITEAFNLDFSDKTSVSFQNVKMTKVKGHPCAVVKFSSSKDE